MASGEWRMASGEWRHELSVVEAVASQLYTTLLKNCDFDFLKQHIEAIRSNNFARNKHTLNPTL